jgi:hypothetical protein
MVFLAGVVFTACLTVPANALSQNALVVAGSGNTWSELWFARTVTFSKRPTGLVTRRCGRYGGIYIQALTAAAPGDVGFVDVARFDHRGLFYRQPIGLGLAARGGIDDGMVRLPRGRYRVHLLGDGPACEVRLPITQGLSRPAYVHPSKPFPVQYADASLDAARVGGAAAGVTTVPVDVRASTYVVAATHYWMRSTDAQDAERSRHAAACLDEVPAGTCSPLRRVTGNVMTYQSRRHSDGSVSTGVTLFEYVTPGAASGTRYAKASAGVLSGEWSADAALLAFDVSRQSRAKAP